MTKVNKDTSIAKLFPRYIVYKIYKTYANVKWALWNQNPNCRYLLISSLLKAVTVRLSGCLTDYIRNLTSWPSPQGWRWLVGMSSVERSNACLFNSKYSFYQMHTITPLIHSIAEQRNNDEKKHWLCNWIEFWKTANVLAIKASGRSSRCLWGREFSYWLEIWLVSTATILNSLSISK